MARERIGVWLAKKAILEGLGVKHPIIFDVGAHFGNITEFYRRMFPERTIHCFEPEPEAYKTLERRYADDPTVHTHQLAVGAVNGTATLHVGGNRGEMSSLNGRPDLRSTRRYYRHPLKQQVTVDVVSIDQFMEEHGIPRIHILKADIHGGEGALLKGATNLLVAEAIPLIYMEVFFVQMYRESPLLVDLWDFLAGFGYTLYDLYNLGRSFVNRQLKYGDVLFVNSAARRRVLDKFPEEWLRKSRVQALGEPS
jgi:FkbM family methyltransferase